MGTPGQHSASAVVKMKSLVFIGFLLTLMIGDIVGPGNNGGGDDNDKEPPRNIIMRNPKGGGFTGGGGSDGDDGGKDFPQRSSADDEVHFIKDKGVQRQGRQSVLGCM